MVCSIRIGQQLLFTQNNPVYQKRLGRIQPDHNSRMNANGKDTFYSSIWVGSFDLPLKMFVYFENYFPVGRTKLSYHLRSD